METRPTGPLGCSAHSVEAVLAAAALGADYVQLGTMFATQTHPGKVPEGPGLATECRRALDELEAPPLLVARSATPLLIGVGGVDATNAATLVEAGCDGVAVIRGISDASDPEAAARAICRALAGAGTRDTELSDDKDNFDGEGFANYLLPYAIALIGSIAATAAVFKFVLLDY